MGSFRLDHLLDFLTSAQMIVGVLWLGLATLTVALLMLTRTRWGQSKPLRKCLALSLLAHMLLAGYATTVQIVGSGSLEAQEPVIRVSIADERSQREETADAATLAEKPWESFVHESAVGPTPLELARAEPVETPQPDRRPQPEHGGLSHAPPLERLPLAEAVQAEPEALAADTPMPAPVARKVAEPIDAPAAQRRQTVRTEGPPSPQPGRPAYADTLSTAPDRKSRGGLPSALMEQPTSVHSVDDVPTTPDPQDLLTGTVDSVGPASKGQPSELSDPQQPQRGSSSELAFAIGRAGSQADHLRPPSVAMRDTARWTRGGEAGAAHAGSPEIGPPLLPVARGNRADRQLPDIYRLRVAPDRYRLAQHYGATAETEEAVRAALQWLADNQEPDGRWMARKHGAGRELMVAGRDRLRAGIQADTGMTALALLAFLASGHTHQEGPYRSTVRRGLEYLLSQQAGDGGLGGRATTFAFMYCHAMATLALSEAYGMTGETALQEPVRRAVAYTLSMQNPSSGGWRYRPGDPGDTSQLGWQLMALKSAELAGIPMPDRAYRGVIRFLEGVCSGDHGGLAAYRPGERVSKAMTAEALACRQFLGMAEDHSAGREAGDYLLGELPGEGPANLYYWYYGTLAMFQLQGIYWQRWNDALRTVLVQSQRNTGPLAGSWDPDTVWGGYGGRVYSTALATLCLEVYYRYLPLYVDGWSQGPPAS